MSDSLDKQLATNKSYTGLRLSVSECYCKFLCKHVLIIYVLITAECFISYKNRSSDSNCKSNDWFL